MTVRMAQIVLIFAVALFYGLIVFNNIADYNSNYQFVRHVLMMDTITPGSPQLWRAVNTSAFHTGFFVTIVAWELLTMVLCGWGGLRLARVLHHSSREFQQAKRLAVAGLVSALLMWFVAFLCVGGEWFLMWQSNSWNGQQAAFRMFTVLGVILLLLIQPDAEERPQQTGLTFELRGGRPDGNTSPQRPAQPHSGDAL